MRKVLVIGGGASGMMAAISAARQGAAVTIYEKTDRVGKKILATGNGKCNLTNLVMGPEHYYTSAPQKLKECLEIFSAEDTMQFFQSLGLMLRDREGYVYPYCEQAAVVLDVLRRALEEQKIILKTSVTEIRITADIKGCYHIFSSVGREAFDAVILACGSKAGIKNADDAGYTYAKAFGHKIHTLYPALVQIRCRESFFKSISGVRCKAKITLFADDKTISSEQGELQWTDYGVSGIPVFQISRFISRYLEEKKKVDISIDFLPNMRKEEWITFCKERMKLYKGKTAEEFLLGILHKKISMLMLKESGLKPTDILNPKDADSLVKLCNSMKDFHVTPVGVNSFEHAQVCRGGVAFEELDKNLQSLYQPNLYICGEMIDIDGKCGGYNLQWAWTSGYIAGTAASK